MHKNRMVAGFFLPRITAHPNLLGSSMQEILGWVVSGQVKLQIGARSPLARATEAHRALERSRETTSKIVLNP